MFGFDFGRPVRFPLRENTLILISSFLHCSDASWLLVVGQTIRSAPSAAVVQFTKEASQTRDYCVAKNATLRAARPDPSLRKKRFFRMTIKQHYCRKCPDTRKADRK